MKQSLARRVIFRLKIYSTNLSLPIPFQHDAWPQLQPESDFFMCPTKFINNGFQESLYFYYG